MPQSTSFTGFSQKTLEFLKHLFENNNKAWFENHRSAYERHLLNPMKTLVSDLAEFMLSIDPYFEVTPAVNKTISRIYRDTRFSWDKSPFRSNMWIVFKRPRKDWMDAPGYFFEIFQDGYRYGMGFYQASKQTMDRFRESIDDDPKSFLEAISLFNDADVFQIEGEEYKRILDPDKPDALQAWYQKKSFCLIHNSSIDKRLFSDQLIRDMEAHFQMAAPFYHYLAKIKFASK